MKYDLVATINIISEIQHERVRQVRGEGWTTPHDDAHVEGELSAAAGCYALNAACLVDAQNGEPLDFGHAVSLGWRWTREWWKPTTPRRDLIKAAALIVAEIERLDRAEKCTPSAGREKEV